MIFIYSKWTDKSLTDEQRLEQLFSLFSYLLIQNNGKAYYTGLNDLGEQVFVDYFRNKRRMED